MYMKTFLFFVFLFLCLSRFGFSQNINKDSLSFVHSHGMIDEDNPQSVLLANELYRIHVKTKADNYPPFYGGSYIKNDSIVVLLADDVSFTDIITIATDTSLSYLRLKPCRFSYDELLNANRLLNDFYFRSSNRNIVDNIIGWSSWYLSVPDNKILIRLQECTEKKIKSFKKYVLNSPMLLFVEADKNIHI